MAEYLQLFEDDCAVVSRGLRSLLWADDLHAVNVGFVAHVFGVELGDSGVGERPTDQSHQTWTVIPSISRKCASRVASGKSYW